MSQPGPFLELFPGDFRQLPDHAGAGRAELGIFRPPFTGRALVAIVFGMPGEILFGGQPDMEIVPPALRQRNHSAARREILLRVAALFLRGCPVWIFQRLQLHVVTVFRAIVGHAVNVFQRARRAGVVAVMREAVIHLRSVGQGEFRHGQFVMPRHRLQIIERPEKAASGHPLQKVVNPIDQPPPVVPGDVDIAVLRHGHGKPVLRFLITNLQTDDGLPIPAAGIEFRPGGGVQVPDQLGGGELRYGVRRRRDRIPGRAVFRQHKRPPSVFGRDRIRHESLMPSDIARDAVDLRLFRVHGAVAQAERRHFHPDRFA